MFHTAGSDVDDPARSAPPQRAAAAERGREGDLTSTRDLGQVEVTTISAGAVHWRPVAPLADALRGEDVSLDPEDRVVFGQNWLCARTRDDVVLVDPTAWSVGDEFGSLSIGRAYALEHGLASVGVAAGEVTHVVVTHGHIDHMTGLLAGDGSLRFPGARHHFPRADWTGLAAETAMLEPARAAGRLKLTDGDTAICPGVVVLAAPGETAGHQVVEVTGASGRAYYLGDLVHFAFEFADPEWSVVPGKDLEVLAAGRRRVCDRAVSDDAVVAFTHADRPEWGRLDRRGAGWRYGAAQCL